MKLGFLGAAVVAATMLVGASGAFAFQFVNPDTNPDGRNAPTPWMQERFLQSPAARTVPSQGW